MGRRHVHGRLVRLQRDEAVLDLDTVAGRDEDLDDLDVGKITEVRNLQLDLVGH